MVTLNYRNLKLSQSLILVLGGLAICVLCAQIFSEDIDRPSLIVFAPFCIMGAASFAVVPLRSGRLLLGFAGTSLVLLGLVSALVGVSSSQLGGAGLALVVMTVAVVGGTLASKSVSPETARREEEAGDSTLESAVSSPASNVLAEFLANTVNVATAAHDVADGETVMQSWSRVLSQTGEDRLEGTVRVHFQEGERIQHIHVPVSPPFASTPQVWCECEEERFKVTTNMVVHTYGTRITVRRSQLTAIDETVDVSIVMVANQDSQAAA